MIAAIDSSIVLDILLDDAIHADNSMRLIEENQLKGAVIMSPVAFAECAAALSSPDKFENVAREMDLIYEPFTTKICTLAANFWRQYRQRRGPKQRIMADFLIGAHAQVLADALLTRDRGFFRDYFKDLTVLTS